VSVAGEEHRWSVRVVANDRREASFYARSRRVDLGPALTFDRDDPRTCALEHVLGALGADVATGVLRAARRRRVEVHSVEAAVEGSLRNALTWLGVVGEEGDPGIERVKVRVYVSGPAESEDVEGVWQEALAASPLVRTLRGAVDLEVSYRAVP
jgi:hypothetical protein